MSKINQQQVRTESHLPGVKLFSRGKVRDVYEAGNALLIVATDRLSAFDVVLGAGIPDKGRVLTQLSRFWFEFLQDVVPNHFLTCDLRQYPDGLGKFEDQLEGRSMLVRRATAIPVECVARGYLAGSGWAEYRATGSVCGARLPKGLRESEELPQPIFTPATKASTGHDENITFEEVTHRIGRATAERLREMTLALYGRARDYARQRGILIADTKFEFGTVDDQLILIDEVLTPDSSRFWPKGEYQPGRPQPSFDKQFVRDYLLSISWNKQPPPPPLPAEVIEKTAEKYREAYRLLTGKNLK